MPGQHQRRQRVVDHRLVVDREQLLADRAGQRVQARAGAAGEDDAFHRPAARRSGTGAEPRGSMIRGDRPTSGTIGADRDHADVGKAIGRAVRRAMSASTIIWTSPLEVDVGLPAKLLPAPCRSRRSGDRLRPGGGSAGSSCTYFCRIEADVAERGVDQIADRVAHAGRDDVVVRLVLLQHQPHRADVVAGEAPVALARRDCRATSESARPSLIRATPSVTLRVTNSRPRRGDS